MKRRFTSNMLLAGLALAPLALAAPTPVAIAQSVVRPSSEIVLSIGRGELVNVPGTMADIFVANDDIADVQVKSQRQLYVLGKAQLGDYGAVDCCLGLNMYQLHRICAP